MIRYLVPLLLGCTPAAAQFVSGSLQPDGTTLISNNGKLSVTYGTTADTAVQGNDSRLVNAASAASVAGALGAAIPGAAAALPYCGTGAAGAAQPCGAATVLPAGSDASATNVTAAGAPTPRSTAARAADTLNVADFGMTPTNTAAQNATAWAAVHARYEALGGSARIFIPAGGYNLDVSAGPFILDGRYWAVDGPGALIVPVNGTTVLQCQPANPVAYPWAGNARISGLSIYRTDNPTSGASIVLDNCNDVMLENLTLTGGYRNLWLKSSVAIFGRGLNLGGANSTAGSTIFAQDQSTTSGFANPNSSENFFTDLDFRGGVHGAYDYGIAVSNADGTTFAHGHVGFVNYDSILVKPGGTTTQLTGLTFVAVDTDGSGTGTSHVGNGYHFAAPGGYSGSSGYHRIIGSAMGFSNGSGVLAEDPALIGLSITNPSIAYAGQISGDGITVSAGSDIDIIGGAFHENNSAGGNARHIRIGGTASGVYVGGVAFAAGTQGYTVPYDLGVEGTARNVMVAPNLHSGATSGPVNNTSTGSGNVVLDAPVGGGLALSSGISVGTGASDYLVLSGGTGNVTLQPGGTSSNTVLNLLGKGTGGVTISGGSYYFANGSGLNSTGTIKAGTASPDYVVLSGGAGTVLVQAQGADGNVGLGLNAKGSGVVGIGSPLYVSGAAQFAGTLTTAPATPATSAAACAAGQISVDASYVYVCTATNTWKRVALASW